MNLSKEDVQKILRVIDELEYGEIRLEIGDLKIHVQKSGQSAPMPATRLETGPPSEGSAPELPHVQSEPATTPGKSPQASAPRAEPVAVEGRHFVKAPTSGVFYRASGPGAEPFVRIGQIVAPEDTVCLLEVMKLFTSVAAGISGRVVEACAEDGDAVSKGQVLFAIDPA